MNAQRGREDNSKVPQKPSVFLSYAHKDGMAIARRIVRSLEPYCDEVFWDQKLRAGDWQQQLAGRIQSHDFFLVVMSPAQAASEMCEWELGLALERLQTHAAAAFGIVPIKRFSDHHDVRLEKFQYADFSHDFDHGFGDLTQIMFGVRRPSWEYLASQPAGQLLAGIQTGFVPALIVLECCDRLIVERVWTQLDHWLRDAQPHLVIGKPQLPLDILAQTERLIPQVAARLDGISVHRLLKAKELLTTYIERKATVSEDDHEAAGELAIDLAARVRGYLTMDAAARLSAIEVSRLSTYFDSDVAEIFRVAIRVHARAMRLLY